MLLEGRSPYQFTLPIYIFILLFAGFTLFVSISDTSLYLLQTIILLKIITLLTPRTCSSIILNAIPTHQLTVIESVQEIAILTFDTFIMLFQLPAVRLCFGALAIRHGQVSINTHLAITIPIIFKTCVMILLTIFPILKMITIPTYFAMSLLLSHTVRYLTNTILQFKGISTTETASMYVLGASLNDAGILMIGEGILTIGTLMMLIDASRLLR